MMNSLFPTYDVEKFAIKICLNDENSLPLKFISLDHLYLEKEIQMAGNIRVSVSFKDKSFNLQGYIDNHYRSYKGREYSVIRLYFDDYQIFSKWNLFIKVIHKTKLKKQLQSLL